MPKGRAVPNDAKLIYAAFVVQGRDDRLSLFHSEFIAYQALKWNDDDIGRATFVIDAHFGMRGPRVIYVGRDPAAIPPTGRAGIYLPSGTFVQVTPEQPAQREILVGGVRLDSNEGKKL